MGWKKKREVPKWIRTYKNWKKYRAYIKEYQGVRDDLVDQLLQMTIDHGFNKGVEMFAAFDDFERVYARDKKEQKLLEMSKMNSVTLEQMVAQKEAMEKAAEEQKKYVFDPNWKPTAQEMLQSNYTVYEEKVVNKNNFFRIYDVYQKRCYVGVSVVEGCAPEVKVSEYYTDIKNTLGKVFDRLTSNIKPEKTVRVIKSSKSQIDNVRKAMGIDEEQQKRNKNLDDMIDGLF